MNKELYLKQVELLDRKGMGYQVVKLKNMMYPEVGTILEPNEVKDKIELKLCIVHISK